MQFLWSKYNDYIKVVCELFKTNDTKAAKKIEIKDHETKKVKTDTWKKDAGEK
jgi:hypothetical protein